MPKRKTTFTGNKVYFLLYYESEALFQEGILNEVASS